MCLLPVGRVSRFSLCCPLKRPAEPGSSLRTRLSLDTSSARASPTPPSCLPSSARPAQPRGERWQLGTRQQSQKQQRSCLAASQTLACSVIFPELAALLPPEVPTLPSHTCLFHGGPGVALEVPDIPSFRVQLPLSLGHSGFSAHTFPGLRGLWLLSRSLTPSPSWLEALVPAVTAI